MPLPVQNRLYFPYPNPENPADHSLNQNVLRQWADRLPFFGPAYTYHVRPSDTGVFESFNFAHSAEINRIPSIPRAVPFICADLHAPTASFPYPFSGTQTSNGARGILRFPYRKEESFTSIQVDLNVSAYILSALPAETAVNTCCVLRLRNVDDERQSIATALPPSNAPYIYDEGDFLAARTYINWGAPGFGSSRHQEIAGTTTIIPAHSRGWWTLELRVGVSIRTLRMDLYDTIKVTIREVLTTGPEYPGWLP